MRNSPCDLLMKAASIHHELQMNMQFQLQFAKTEQDGHK